MTVNNVHNPEKIYMYIFENVHTVVLNAIVHDNHFMVGQRAPHWAQDIFATLNQRH